MSGIELASASSYVQTNFTAADGWVYVEGLDFYLTTTDRPVYLTADLGIVIIGGVTPGELTSFEIGIVDETNAKARAYATVGTGKANSTGDASAGTPLLGFRVDAGTAKTRFIVRIKCAAGQFGYCKPTWAPDYAATFSAKEA